MNTSAKFTPEEISRAALVYSQTGSFKKAALAIGKNVTDVRHVLEKNMVSAIDYEESAIARGLSAGRKALELLVEKGAQILVHTEDARDFSSLSSGISKAIDTTIQLSLRADKKRLDKLVRAKLRAEIELLRAKIAAGDISGAGVAIDTSDPQAIERAIREAFGNAGNFRAETPAE